MNFQASQLLKTSLLKSFFLALMWLAIQSNLWSQCNPGDIGGVIFRDVPAEDASNANIYGVKNNNENGLAGISITVVDAMGAIQTTTTDALGNWSVTPAVFPVRVEYAWTNIWLEISPGSDKNTEIQIFDSADCDAEFGLYYPDEYCQMVPDVITSCFVSGDPMGGGTTGTIDAVVSFPYNNLGDTLSPNHDAIMSEVGAVWGAAYNGYNKHAFLAAVMKRHVGLGPAGIGGIYRIDYSGAAPAASIFLDLSALGVNVGTEPTRVLNAAWSVPSSDSLMFDAAGKLGLGDVDISDDGNTLFVVNLFAKKIITIDLTNYNTTGTIPGTAEIDSLPALPSLACTNGELRPFAIKYRRGMIYVGTVCTAENSGSTADLNATVWQYDISNGIWSAAINTFSLDYTKGGAVDNTCTTWQPWISTYDNAVTNCRTTPMLTDIEFDGDSTILLGFADRYTFQKFTLQLDSTSVNPESVINGGDILRGYLDGSTYVMESNGTIPSGGGCGANGQGIGGGEFFCGDSIGTEHSEISLGAIAVLPGTGELLLSVINPVNYNSGGVRRFDLMTGASDTTMGYELYETSGATFPTGNGFAVKGGGMGDLELLCNAAPIEVLGYIWEDSKADGVQDPFESGIENVEVSLFDNAGNLLQLATTDSRGLYIFSDTLEPFTTYFVAIGTDGGFNLADSTLNDSLYLTTPDIGMGSNADNNDSDIFLADAINPSFDGYPYYTFTTSASGQLFHHLDAGFFPPCTDPKLVTTSTTICIGTVVDLVDFVADANPSTMSGGTLSYFDNYADAVAEMNNIGSTVSPTDTIMYYVRKNTDDLTCFDIDSITVNVNPMPVLVTSDVTLCSGDTTSLDAWTIEITGQAVNTEFYLTLADAMGETNVLSSSEVFPTDTTLYYVRVTTSDAPYCFDIDSLLLSVIDCSFDLAMKMELSVGQTSPVDPGETVYHTIWVYNQGGLDAYDVALMAYLSPGISFDNNIGTNSNWEELGVTLIDTLVGPIASGDSVSVELALTIDPFYSASSISTFIEITGYDNDTNDNNTPPTDEDSVTDTDGFNDLVIDDEINDNPDNPNDDDDHDIQTVFVNSIFDLALLVQDFNAPVSPCDTVTYGMWIYNQANTAAYDIVLTDYLPTGMTFDQTLPNNTNWELVGGLPTDSISGPLAPGDSIMINLDLIVDCAYTGTSIANFMEITGYDDDTDDGNTPPSDEDSVTDLDPANDQNIDNEINDNPDNPADDDDHDGSTLFVFQGATPIIDTLYFTTLENAALTNLCMDINDLSAAITSVNSCGDPNNGVLNISSPDVCIGYTPSNGFNGQDTACVVVCDANALCDTTILVFTVTPLPTVDIDTMYFTTAQNITLTNLCMDLSELTNPVDAVLSCGSPSNGMLTISSPSECVDYIPNNNFNGQDTACVVVCDVNALCDTTIVVFTVMPMPSIDTMPITLVVDNTMSSICMDLSELNAAVVSVTSCGDPVNGTLNISSPNECVSYTPDNGYIGQDTACVVVCDANAVCDTTILVFNITPDCSGVLTETSIAVMLDDCADIANVCLNVPTGDISDYSITDNGSPYLGSLQACDFDTLFQFPYGSLPGMGSTGPYTVNEWIVNGVTYFGIVADMQALTDSMNVWNPSGNWMLNASSLVIIGGSTSDVFGNIDMVSTELFWMMNLTPNGTAVELPNGNHNIVFTDNLLGCSDTVQIAVNCINCPDLFTGTEELTAADCDSQVEFCTPILLTDISNYIITDNGQAFNGSIGACNMNAAIALDTGYHVLIFNDSLNNCLDTAMVNVSCSGCSDIVQNNLITLDDCDDLAAYCIRIPPSDVAEYTIEDNGVLFTGSMVGCDFDSLVTYITLGFNLTGSYTLNEWIVGVDTFGVISFSTAAQLVDSMNVWNPSGNWSLAGLFITGQGSVSNFGPLVVEDAIGNETASTATLQLSPNGVAMQLDTGLHIITTLEIATGCTDTATVQIDCLPPGGLNCDLAGADIQALSLNDCSGTADLCLNIPLTAVIDFEIYDNGSLFTGPTGGCVLDSFPTYSYVLLTGGGNFGPYTLDGWTVNGLFYSGVFANIDDLVDSMNVWNPAGNWMHDDANNLIVGTTMDKNYGPLMITHSNTNTSITLMVVYQPFFTQLSIGLSAGDHEIIIQDLVNNCSDTAMVTVACINPDILLGIVPVNEIDTLCFDLSELPGTAVSIVNYCENSSGDFVLFEPIASTYCLSFEGVEVGQDSACIAICDGLGFCDTTWVYITVVEDGGLPDANQDSIYTSINTSITVDLTANDDLAGGPDSITIIEFPEHGDIFVDLNGVVLYRPVEDYCDSAVPDKITYEICNNFGCDTTEVFFFVECTELTFVSGFSPNGDGINDVFYIEGINNYTNHTLNIFNRWGNEVYTSFNYQNDWRGTFNEDLADLPDGTYFYVFDTGEGEMFSGYVQINR